MSRWRELDSALVAAETLCLDELPEFIGELERVRITALARLSLSMQPNGPLKSLGMRNYWGAMTREERQAEVMRRRSLWGQKKAAAT